MLGLYNKVDSDPNPNPNPKPYLTFDIMWVFCEARRVLVLLDRTDSRMLRSSESDVICQPSAKNDRRGASECITPAYRPEG